MKRLLIFLLVIFLLVDVFLAANLFYPNLSSDVTQKITYHQITVSSTSPDIKVSLVNEKYLNEKLSKLDFWGDKKVITNYDKPFNHDYVTVERIKFIITDKPQTLGVNGDPKSKKGVEYSYGQLYDRSTKTMTILLHLNRSIKSARPLKDSYTGIALFALFDMTHPRTPDNGASYFKSLASFMPEYVVTPGKYFIFNINTDK